MKLFKDWHFVFACLITFIVASSPFALVKANPHLDSSGVPIHVIGRVTLTLDHDERLEYDKLTQVLFEKTTALDHPTLYTCNEDISSPGTFVWDEVWSSKHALDKHLASAHFKSWWAWVEPHVKGSLQVLYVDQSLMKTV